MHTCMYYNCISQRIKIIKLGMCTSFLSSSQETIFIITFNSVTVARPAPPDVPLVSTPLVSESTSEHNNYSKLILTYVIMKFDKIQT